jgi:hypothetical protein
VYSHKVAGRDFKAYNPYSHPQPYSPVPFRNRSLVVGAAGGGDKQSHGVIKRSPATVKWLSPEQNMAKMEGMRRHEEQLHKAEKDRIMQQGQTQNSAMYFAANAGRAPSATIPPKVITIQGTKFQVSSGGNKLLRLSGTFDATAISRFHSPKNRRRVGFGRRCAERDRCLWCTFYALQEGQLASHECYQTRVGQ